MLDKFMAALSRHEGFNLKGSVAQRLNNPGNLTAGVAKYYGRSIGTWKNPASGIVFAEYAKVEDGWADLADYLKETSNGEWRGYRLEALGRFKKASDLTMPEYFGVYAPIGWENILLHRHKPNVAYASSIASQLAIKLNTTIGELVLPDQLDPLPEPTPETFKPTIENQRDKKWAGHYLGKSKSGYNGFGCKLFSLTLMYSIKLGRYVSPDEVNDILYKGGAYFNGDMLDDAKSAKALGLEYYGKETNINKPPNWPISIKEVDFSIASGKQQHFLVRCVDETGKYILDPYAGVRRKINFYEEKVHAPNWEGGRFSYRKFKI